VEQPDGILEQRQLTAKICHQMAEHAIAQRHYEGAIQQYKEALQYYPEDEVWALSLLPHTIVYVY
jgi:hypothetical protein